MKTSSMKTIKKTSQKLCLADVVNSIYETALEETQNKREALIMTEEILKRILIRTDNFKALDLLLEEDQELIAA
jgi:hypothetical protein